MDLTNVVMGNGREFVNSNTVCHLCGQKGGLKLKCDHPGCHTDPSDPKSSQTYFHVTCARQAGLQVDVEEQSSGGMKFFGEFQMDELHLKNCC